MRKSTTTPTTGNCAANRHCDNYKQLVWTSTSEVGCGIELCHTTTYEKTPPLHERIYAFVCYYNPDGNIGDRKPYRRGRSCSKCNKQGSGTWGSENNLCVLQ